MHYKPDPKKLSHTHAALSKPALFLGWQLGAGHRWTKLYKVLDYEALLKGQFQVQQIREVAIHKCEPQRYHYPLAAAREKALEIFDSTAFPDVVAKLPPLEQYEKIGAVKDSAPSTSPPKLKPPNASQKSTRAKARRRFAEQRSRCVALR